MKIRPALLLLVGGCTDWESFSRDYVEDDSCATFIVAGDSHTCVRTSSAALLCWGDNRFGQLGTGDTMNRSRPTRIKVGDANLGAVKVYIPTGNGDITSDLTGFTCVIASDNALWCWGDNHFGQLGTGTTENAPRPVRINGLPAPPSKVTSGSGHTCVLMTNGALACFGRNVQGELGVGDQEQRTTPAVVDFGGPVERLAAGGDFTCAGGTDAVLRCWGANTFGQLGNGTTDRALKPVAVTALGSRVGRIATGGAHTCAITADDGHVHCWGDNRSGQLGTGDTQRKLTPVEVDPQGLGAVRTNSLFGGGAHTCALRDDNTFWCWGGNRFGQLGTGDTQPHVVPIKVLDGVTAAYTGGAHTCAVLTDGSVKCWGSNQYGQLGAEVGSESLTPTTVLGACKATAPKPDP